MVKVDEFPYGVREEFLNRAMPTFDDTPLVSLWSGITGRPRSAAFCRRRIRSAQILMMRS